MTLAYEGLTANENEWLTRLLLDYHRIEPILRAQRLRVHAIGLPMDHEVVRLLDLPVVRCDTDVPFLMIEVGKV